MCVCEASVSVTTHKHTHTHTHTHSHTHNQTDLRIRRKSSVLFPENIGPKMRWMLPLACSALPSAVPSTFCDIVAGGRGAAEREGEGERRKLIETDRYLLNQTERDTERDRGHI